MTRVAYILGWGRSGTTLLDALVGALPGSVSVGELRYLWERGVVSGQLCGCGVPVPECSFWRHVLRNAELEGHAAAQNMRDLQHRVVRARHFPRLLMGETVHGTAEWLELRQNQENLYRSIERTAGSSLIVDSSKRPSDAALLSGMQAVDSYFIHMVRNPRAVAYSMRSRKATNDPAAPPEMTRRRIGATAAGWMSWNAAANILGRRVGRSRYIVVRYEDLVADPPSELGRIAELLGFPQSAAAGALRRVADMGPAHTVAGNPIRFTDGELQIQVDDRWRRNESPLAKIAIRSLCYPLMKRYRYR